MNTWCTHSLALSQEGWTALHYAALGDRGPCVDALLDAGAKRSLKTSDGEMPADVALRMRHHAVGVTLHVWSPQKEDGETTTGTSASGYDTDGGSGSVASSIDSSHIAVAGLRVAMADVSI